MDIKVGITDKVAVITGGAGVLCSSMCREFARQGAKVAVLDLRSDDAQRVADEINAAGGTAIGIGVDVLSKDSLEQAKEAVLSAYGTVDILINGAGGNNPQATTGPDRSFFDLTVQGIQNILNLNFMGTVIPTQVFGKVMADKKKGIIINISSMAAYTPLTRTIAYSAAKAAVSNFTQWMAVHFNKEYSSDIRVNAIAPGFLLTDQNRYLLTDEKTGEPTPRGCDILRATPMGKYGVAEDLLGTVLFLCSDSASFINGAVIPIDGAFSAFSGV
jgi:NAD(P)-dependent dehydrogenase (short-subunit alcohol dehydrogenase family)